jgi:hypothetical protein
MEGNNFDERSGNNRICMYGKIAESIYRNSILEAAVEHKTTS